MSNLLCWNVVPLRLVPTFTPTGTWLRKAFFLVTTSPGFRSMHLFLPRVMARAPSCSAHASWRLRNSGPRSLVYHEGRAYRVTKAKASWGRQLGDNGNLATGLMYVCEHCGAAHLEELERCLNCGRSLAGLTPIQNLLRIDNVETQPAVRITSNDEDRQRQGFEIQSVFEWPMRQGHSTFFRLQRN